MQTFRTRYRSARVTPRSLSSAGHRHRRPRFDVRLGWLRPDRRTRTRGTVPDWWQRGTATGGLLSVLLVAIGLYLTNNFNRDQIRLQQDSTQQQQDLAVKGQRADRFVKAIEQLGQE